jgi:hypothetical protein
MKMKVVLLVLMLMGPVVSWAQCAMCRTQLENNVANGNPGIAAGINTGILYLLSMPYLIIMILGYFWYRNSKRNEQDQLNNSTAAR